MTRDPSAHRSAVVLVDDDPLSLRLLAHLAGEIPDTRVVTFGDPAQAAEWCRTHEPDLVITDQQMPGISGIELVRELRAEPRLCEVPILVVTTVQDREVRREAVTAGANDYLLKPLDPVEATARIRNMLALRRNARALAGHAAALEQGIARALAAVTAREHEVIVRLARAAEYRDWETGAHIVRVAWYARLIARGLGMSAEEQDVIFRAAPMHDVGKIGVPDHILLKPSGLDEVEFGIMKQHTVIGHRILVGSESNLLRMAADIALTHHERFDGGGYPEGLFGENIPLSGRIVAVADTYDALTSERPYKSEWPRGLAFAYLQQCAGNRFDPACVRPFLSAEDQVAEIRASFPDTHSRPSAQPLTLLAPPDHEPRHIA